MSTSFHNLTIDNLFFNIFYSAPSNFFTQELTSMARKASNFPHEVPEVGKTVKITFPDDFTLIDEIETVVQQRELHYSNNCGKYCVIHISYYPLGMSEVKFYSGIRGWSCTFRSGKGASATAQEIEVQVEILD
jgi:hypothetical protein